MFQPFYGKQHRLNEVYKINIHTIDNKAEDQTYLFYKKHSSG